MNFGPDYILFFNNISYENRIQTVELPKEFSYINLSYDNLVVNSDEIDLYYMNFNEKRIYINIPFKEFKELWILLRNMINIIFDCYLDLRTSMSEEKTFTIPKNIFHYMKTFIHLFSSHFNIKVVDKNDDFEFALYIECPAKSQGRAGTIGQFIVIIDYNLEIGDNIIVKYFDSVCLDDINSILSSVIHSSSSEEEEEDDDYDDDYIDSD